MNDRNKPQTVKQLLQWAAFFLGKENRLEAEVLLAEVCQYSRAKLLAYTEELLSKEKTAKFIEFVEARKKGEPLQYLTGKQNFMGLDFKVNKDVLIPRSDTEVLVEEVINIVQSKSEPIHILDLCTGSGAIAVSLAKYILQSRIVATDISEKALAMAEANAQANGVKDKITFLRGDLFEPVEKYAFDVIASNPPYISTSEMEQLPEDVKREPSIALWGGEDGLDFYRKIISKASKHLKRPGFLLLEIGYLQAESVKTMCFSEGFSQCQVIKDWSKLDRVIKAVIN